VIVVKAIVEHPVLSVEAFARKLAVLRVRTHRHTDQEREKNSFHVHASWASPIARC
jgi:hypothetical protein